MIRISLFQKSLLGLAVLLGFFAFCAYAQEKEAYSITVEEPQNDNKVGREAIVKGLAVIPRGNYLWVLARSSEFNPLWWPQREAEIDPKTGKWSGIVVLGGPQDIGKDFDIGVIAVNAEDHAVLKDYRIKAMRTGDWPPIEIPKTSLPPQMLKVKKTSH